MNKQLTRVAIFVSAFCVLAPSIPVALAGGSSYAFYSHGHTGIVQTGAILPGAFQLNMQTYIDEEYFRLNQIAVKTVKLSCLGEDALESATLKRGTEIVAEAAFSPSPVAAGWYKALLQPSNLILENDSVYNLAIDFKAKPGLTTTKAVTCKAQVMQHEQLLDGGQVKDNDYDMASELTESKATVIVVPPDHSLLGGKLSRIVDDENNTDSEPALTVWGGLYKSGNNSFQLNVNREDWVSEGMYNVMLPFTGKTPIKFDVTSPRFFTTEEQSYTHHWRISEMHLYDKVRSNGSVGSIQLGRIQ